jgi:beta-lactamase superfamily II metal-dependent hydrolase
MEFEQESVLLSTGAGLKCDVLKVGNHADNDTGSEAFIRAASPEIAVISTSTEEKPDSQETGEE